MNDLSRITSGPRDTMADFRASFGFALGLGAAAALGSVEGIAEVSFTRDIQPILAENYLACHGPDPATREARLRLDIQEAWFERRADGNQR